MVFTNLICLLYSAIYENTVSWQLTKEKVETWAENWIRVKSLEKNKNDQIFKNISAAILCLFYISYNG